MRISSGFVGIIVFAALILLTGVCSVATFAFTQDFVVGMWESGQPIESPLEVVQAFINPEDFQATDTPMPTTATNNGLVTIPSITPFPTVAPTHDGISTTEPTQETPVIVASPTTLAVTQESQATQGIDLGPKTINILVMGIDERVGYSTDRAFRTDTMMVVHVDPVRKTAGVLSFPRDLWVTIPAYNEASRLNRASYVGDLNAYPGGGGPALAMETFNANFGIRIDYYLMINFTVFETVVDIIAPDGIEVCITETIRDPSYPDAGFGIINVEFDPGCQMLDGARLLQYARTRATEGGDLDRARRQQETVEAIRSYVLSRGGVQGFITNIGSLWAELAGSYRTNLSIDEAVGLGYLMNEIPRENIRYEVIGAGYVQPGQSSDGTQQILIPIHSRIQDLIQETFYPEIEITLADLRARAAIEAVPIRVFNGTTNISGLAGRTQEFLLGHGVVINEVGNVPNPAGLPTVIRDYGGGRDTARWLAALLELPLERIEIGTDGLAAKGVIVVVGPDIEALLSGGG